jgi:outer membrane protein assembly factor BamD
MRYLVNALAMYDVHVAEYYYNRGAYLAAANRAQASLVNYPQTPANEDALILLMHSYDKLGMPHLRDDAQRILLATYPKGKYFVPGPKPWWQFWGRDSVFQLLEKNTVPKSKADESEIAPP